MPRKYPDEFRARAVALARGLSAYADIYALVGDRRHSYYVGER